MQAFRYVMCLGCGFLVLGGLVELTRDGFSNGVLVLVLAGVVCALVGCLPYSEETPREASKVDIWGKK